MRIAPPNEIESSSNRRQRFSLTRCLRGQDSSDKVREDVFTRAAVAPPRINLRGQELNLVLVLIMDVVLSGHSLQCRRRDSNSYCLDSHSSASYQLGYVGNRSVEQVRSSRPTRDVSRGSSSSAAEEIRTPIPRILRPVPLPIGLRRQDHDDKGVKDKDGHTNSATGGSLLPTGFEPAKAAHTRVM